MTSKIAGVAPRMADDRAYMFGWTATRDAATVKATALVDATTQYNAVIEGNDPHEARRLRGVIDALVARLTLSGSRVQGTPVKLPRRRVAAPVVTTRRATSADYVQPTVADRFDYGDDILRVNPAPPDAWGYVVNPRAERQRKQIVYAWR